MDKKMDKNDAAFIFIGFICGLSTGVAMALMVLWG